MLRATDPDPPSAREARDLAAAVLDGKPPGGSFAEAALRLAAFVAAADGRRRPMPSTIPPCPLGAALDAAGVERLEGP